MPDPVDLKRLRYATIKDAYPEKDHNYEDNLIVEFFDGRKIRIESTFSVYPEVTSGESPEVVFPETPKVYLVGEDE